MPTGWWYQLTIMVNQVVNVLSYLNLFSLLIPISIGFWRWPRLNTSLRIAWAGLLIYFLLFSLSMLMALGLVKLPYVHSFEFINYALAGLFGAAFTTCYALAVPNGLPRVAIIGLGTVGAVGILAELIWRLDDITVSPWAIPVQTVINTIIPIIYLHQLTRTSTVSLLTVPLFWISLGRLVSSLLSTLYDSLRVPMAESSRDLLMQWLCFQLALMVGCNIIYGIGFWKARRTEPALGLRA